MALGGKRFGHIVAVLAFAFAAARASGTALPARKTNVRNVPPGADPTRYIQSSDINGLLDFAGGRFNALNYGMLCDGSTDDSTSLASLISSVGSTAGTLIIPGVCKINTSTVIPSTLKVRFEGSGSFTGTGTVTYTGWLESQSVIATNSVTSRSLASRFSDTINCRDYGAAGDGVADDTAALVACFAAVPAAGRVTMWLPGGTYKVSTTLTWNKPKVHIYGYGATIQWAGGASPVVILTSGAVRQQDSRIFGLTINGNSTATSCLKLMHGALNHINTVVRDVTLLSAKGGDSTSYALVVGEGGNTAYDEISECRFENVYITSHNQIYSIGKFNNVNVFDHVIGGGDGSGTGMYLEATGPTYVINSTELASNTVSFLLKTDGINIPTGGYLTVRDFYNETNALLHTTGANTSQWDIVMDAVSFSSPDADSLYMQTFGSLRLMNSIPGGAAGQIHLAPPSAQPLYFYDIANYAGNNPFSNRTLTSDVVHFAIGAYGTESWMAMASGAAMRGGTSLDTSTGISSDYPGATFTLANNGTRNLISTSFAGDMEAWIDITPGYSSVGTEQVYCTWRLPSTTGGIQVALKTYEVGMTTQFCTAASGTASSFNLYYDAGTGYYILQNKLGYTVTYKMRFHRSGL